MSAAVRVGYKQTEVGVIPEDWSVIKFGGLIEYAKGFPFKSTEYSMNGVRVIRVSDTSYDAILNANPIYVTEHSAPQYAKWALKDFDLLISTVGSKPPMYDSMVGKVVLVTTEHEGALLNQNSVVVRDKQRRSYLQQIFLGHFRTKRYLNWIETILRGNANQASITLKDLFEFSIPLAGLDAEQRAIATALSDVDALLAKLDTLVTKKRDLKVAAMQQLLTGQTRLPGFSGEWEVKRLGDVAHIKTGLKNNDDKVEDGEYPLFVRSQTVERIDSYSYDCEAILVPGEGGVGSIFHYINGKFDCHQRVYKISAFNADTCGKFVFFCMKHFFHIQATRNSVKATVDSLRLPTFLEFEFVAPGLKEQEAIVETLDDMDAELTALEARRDKTRALKQGMMQELLTGKIRLI